MNKRGVCPGKEPKRVVVSWLQSKGLLAACDVASLVVGLAKPCCWDICIQHDLGLWLSEAEVPSCFLSARKRACSWLQVKPQCSCWCFLLVHCCRVLCFPNELFKLEVKISQHLKTSLSSMDHSSADKLLKVQSQETSEYLPGWLEWSEDATHLLEGEKPDQLFFGVFFRFFR